MGFGRLLSSIGVGAATVDTRLERDELVPGGEVREVVEVKGGGSKQEVNGIRLEVQTHYKRESGDTTVAETGTIEHFPISGHQPSRPTRGKRSGSPSACPTTRR